MERLFTSLTLLALSSGLAAPIAAQDPTQTTPPPAEQAEEGQDPDRPVQTPAERKAQLESERDSLQREITFVRTRVANIMDLLNNKLKERELAVRVIDAGTNAGTVITQPKTGLAARIMEPEESQEWGTDVLMTIGNRPIRQAALTSLTNYLKESGSAPTDDVRNQRAMLELVRIENTLASLPESTREAKMQIEQAAAEIVNGASFSETATKYSRGPLVGDATITITRNCPFGLFLEKEAFATEEGKVTPVLPGLTGYVLFEVKKHNKGETSATDTTEGRIILVPYHPDPRTVDEVRARAALGQVEMSLRDKDVINMLPAMLRPNKILPSESASPTKAQDVKKPGQTDAGTPPVKKKK